MTAERRRVKNATQITRRVIELRFRVRDTSSLLLRRHVVVSSPHPPSFPVHRRSRRCTYYVCRRTRVRRRVIRLSAVFVIENPEPLFHSPPSPSSFPLLVCILNNLSTSLRTITDIYPPSTLLTHSRFWFQTAVVYHRQWPG